ncbi:GPI TRANSAMIDASE COMPONENT PIG-S [Salix koriyanagi]|uniref:GPI TRANSAMIDASE COMPONENT PIG-S n=1 Tax=Salix koriyanagi TaxID=2511006 RepID=A0A9Q0YUZ2_9ROSI|nr:GPI TRANSAMIDASE COMPONENT PIG-S [Salix koriyanagi]
MAEEISESPNDPPPETPPSPPSEPEFDSKTMRKTKPGLKRLFLTFTVLVSFLLGFPFLFKSVEIYRSPLPFHDIDILSNDVVSNPILFPCHFQAIFVPSDPKSSSIDTTGIARNLCLSLYKCGSIRAVDLDFSDDESVDEALESAGFDFGGKVYSVVVVVNGDGVEGVKVVVGKYRHAWIVGRDWGVEEVAERLAEIFVKVFVNGGREEGLIHGEFMPVGADGRIVLSFNLLNADPMDWTYDWDFQKIDETLLAPMIDVLGPIANISVESQVLYYTPKFTFSSWDEKLGGYTLSTKDLPFFVNSNEWHLDTSIAAGGRSKILQFVVYVPSAKECPLLLQLPNGEISKTNAFISPMWGGVMVWNPQSCSRDSDSELVTLILSPEDLQKVFEVFAGQFRQLFGLKSGSLHVGSLDTYSLLASEKGFTEWELDFLSRQHTCFNIHSSATTLGSLSKLVQSLPRMIIMDEIGKQVKFSLEAANLARSNASLGFYDASAVSSRQARSLAEDAFFHPSIMSVSYYSFEHCFAVYSPFFLPVSMHVLLAALREWRRYKQEKAKYLLWKAKEKVAS